MEIIFYTVIMTINIIITVLQSVVFKLPIKNTTSIDEGYYYLEWK